jgi:hypothetical protein
LKFLGYVWRVLTNLFYLAMVIYALSSLNGRLETLIISTLGMIYVTIRTIAAGQMMFNLATTTAMQAQLETIRARLDGLFDPTPADEVEDLKKAMSVKWGIDMVFLAIISLLCVLTFFTGLSR